MHGFVAAEPEQERVRPSARHPSLSFDMFEYCIYYCLFISEICFDSNVHSERQPKKLKIATARFRILYGLSRELALSKCSVPRALTSFLWPLAIAAWKWAGALWIRKRAIDLYVKLSKDHTRLKDKTQQKIPIAKQNAKIYIYILFCLAQQCSRHKRMIVR